MYILRSMVTHYGFLFGSVARGEADRASDVDLRIVVAEDTIFIQLASAKEDGARFVQLVADTLEFRPDVGAVEPCSHTLTPYSSASS